MLSRNVAAYLPAVDAAYDEEIKVMQPRMKFRMESLQAILDETAKTDSRAKKLKPKDLVESKYPRQIGKERFPRQAANRTVGEQTREQLTQSNLEWQSRN